MSYVIPGESLSTFWLSLGNVTLKKSVQDTPMGAPLRTMGIHTQQQPVAWRGEEARAAAACSEAQREIYEGEKKLISTSDELGE